MGRVNPLHTIGLKLRNLSGHNHTAATAENTNMVSTRFFKQIDGIFEVLHMAALVRTDGDTLNIFLQCSFHHLCHRAIVGQMNYLNPSTLQNPAHNID